MGDYLISFEEAVRVLSSRTRFSEARARIILEHVPKVESLTDAEQRLFLAAIDLELKVCEKVDRDCPGGINLVNACLEIKRKVKKALWQ